MRKIELLTKSHDRDGFDCGNEPLNIFLKQTARQHADRGVSRTFVLVDEGVSEPKPILGFFSLNLCSIKAGALSATEAKKLPKEMNAAKLGRLAVATAHQRQGIGKTLVLAALERFLVSFNNVGGIGVFVDAKDLEAKRYYEQFGFIPRPSNELELFMPVKTIQEVLKS